jgi:hypothetical protein
MRRSASDLTLALHSQETLRRMPRLSWAGFQWQPMPGLRLKVLSRSNWCYQPGCLVRNSSSQSLETLEADSLPSELHSTG